MYPIRAHGLVDIKSGQVSSNSVLPKEKSSFQHFLTLVSSLSKTDAEKMLTNCLFCILSYQGPPSHRPTLFVGFSKYSNNKRKTFLFSLTLFARFSSRWALATQHQYLGHRHLENIYQYCGVTVEASPLLGCW